MILGGMKAGGQEELAREQNVCPGPRLECGVDLAGGSDKILEADCSAGNQWSC